jgi:hypothetical protein
VNIGPGPPTKIRGSANADNGRRVGRTMTALY